MSLSLEEQDSYIIIIGRVRWLFHHHWKSKMVISLSLEEQDDYITIVGRVGWLYHYHCRPLYKEMMMLTILYHYIAVQQCQIYQNILHLQHSSTVDDQQVGHINQVGHLSKTPLNLLEIHEICPIDTSESKQLNYD